MNFEILDARPLIVALAGSNGAGKTTFFNSHLAQSGLRFVNADEIADELILEAYAAAEVAGAIREALVAKQESFVFETVLSDPVGEKIQFLRDVADQGYHVVLIFIQIADPETSIQRVSMRVAQGGYDVPDEKLLARFARTQENLKRAIVSLPHVIIFDNSDLSRPYRLAEVYRDGESVVDEY